MTVEAFVLAALGAIAGIALFVLAAPLVVAVLPPATPRTFLITWDPLLIGFGIVAALAAAVISSLPATWRLGRPGASARYTREGGAGRSSLAAAQIAVAFVLLIVAGLLFLPVLALGPFSQIPAGGP